jgi:plastocyanin
MRATKKRGPVYSVGVSFLAATTLAAMAIACSSSSNHPVDAAGGSSGHAGQGGQGGQAGAGGAGGTTDGGAKTDGGGDRADALSGFMAFAPCATESAYVSNTTAIAFGGTLGLNYSPACLKTTPGATISFSGDFATHPLIPSTIRITAASNPIVMTTTGTTKSFTFSAPGFYGYFCGAHGDDQGDAMSGVIWVQ